MSIWRWAEFLAPVPPESRITLGEGHTPVVRSRQIGPAVGLTNLHFKLEFCNPSGSYKDRYAAVAISDMVARKKLRCIATSSGNTGAALAAYCAAAPGMECHIAIVEGAPEGKLKQMLAYGANIFRIRRFGLDARTTQDVFDILDRLARAPDAAIQVSSYKYSPDGMTGVRTIAFELSEQFPDVEHVFCQAGGGGLLYGVAEGYDIFVKAGRIPKSPAVECVQPEGNNTISGPLREGREKGQEVVCTTKISGLQVPTVNDADWAIPLCRASGGTGHLVTDEEVWDAQRLLARDEGIFSEPAGATALAGALRAHREGYLRANAKIVCLVTGFGFKDPGSVDKLLDGRQSPLIDATEVERAVLGG